MKYLAFVIIFGAMVLSCDTAKQAPAPQTASTKPQNVEPRKAARISYTCTGNEPFWSVQVKDNSIIFRTPDEGPLNYSYQSPQQRGTQKIFESKAGGSKIKVVIQEATCTDNMSGERFPYTVEVTKDGKIYRGCGK